MSENEHIQFVTGRLAERSLKATVGKLSAKVGFTYTVDVLPITVAALMSPIWVARHISVSPQTHRIILPGYCEGDLAPLELMTDVPIQRGPKDLRRIPDLFGSQPDEDYGAFDIEILAEINHAPRLPLQEILAEAERLRDAGADMIDVGCDPGEAWLGVSDCVKALRDQEHRVSIDSLNPLEIEPAVRAGADLVLSVNSSNRDAAVDWGCEVVVIPDEIDTLAGLDQTVEQLAVAGVPLRIDPILEPIGCGFAASLTRYTEVRRRYPDAEMLMGIGNLTELTDVDSAGINVILLGFCQELSIRSVLTTQVINWARTSVRECDLARRLVHYAVRQRVPPKHREPALVTLRDTEILDGDLEGLEQLASQIRDHNYRVFTQGGEVHVVSSDLHLAERDPFVLFERLLAVEEREISASHAFYLGHEMSKAATALTLGKQYEQDEALDWGYLTVAETSHRLNTGRPSKKTD